MEKAINEPMLLGEVGWLVTVDTSFADLLRYRAVFIKRVESKAIFRFIKSTIFISIVIYFNES